MIPCLCSWAGLCVSFIYWESAIETLKIVTSWLQSNKLSSVLNRFFFSSNTWEIISYVSVPLRCLLKSCQNVQSNRVCCCCPISVTRQAGEQYEDNKKKENNASVLCRHNKKWLFVSREFVGAEWLRASHRWGSIKFRHHEGIPSPTWLCLKVEFSSVSSIGLKGNVISCLSAKHSHGAGENTEMHRNGTESKTQLPHPNVKPFLMYHHCALQNLHLVATLISLVWKLPSSPQATHGPPPLWRIQLPVVPRFAFQKRTL